MHDQALAHERYGCFFSLLASGADNTTNADNDDAQYHLQRAVTLYKEWGANVKVTQLRRKYKALLGDVADESQHYGKNDDVIPTSILVNLDNS